MTQVIIYKTDEGRVMVLKPSAEWVASRGIEAIAAKDVPHGKPYKILDSSELPIDFPQDRWSVDESDLTDGFGAEHDTFQGVQS